MRIALEREEGISGSRYPVVCIVNSDLENIVEKLRNIANNDTSWVSSRTLINDQGLRSTINRIIKITSLTRRPVSISTIDKKEKNIFIDTYFINNYTVAKNITVYPQPNPSTITFTIKLIMDQTKNLN